MANIFLRLSVLVFVLAAGTCIYAHSGIVRGTLLKTDGKPLPYTEVELVPIGSDEIVNDNRLMAVSSMSGKFSFTNVPAGKYTLSINFEDNPNDSSPYRTYFYPVASKRDGAEVIEVPNSAKYASLVFKLPQPLRMRPITAKVLLPDGKPAAAVWTLFFDVDLGRMSGATMRKLDSNGMFSFKAFEGKRYKLVTLIFDTNTEDIFEPGVGILADGDSGVFSLDTSTPVIEIQMKRTKSRGTLDTLIG